jgi:hypothetical protein
MAGNKYPEAHKLILFIEKAPFSSEEKNRLVEMLNANGMTEETTTAVHQALVAISKESFKDDWQRAKFIMDLGNLIKQWQMAEGSKKFKHSR